jgi:hypothetical protein
MYSFNANQYSKIFTPNYCFDLIKLFIKSIKAFTFALYLFFASRERRFHSFRCIISLHSVVEFIKMILVIYKAHFTSLHIKLSSSQIRENCFFSARFFEFLGAQCQKCICVNIYCECKWVSWKIMCNKILFSTKSRFFPLEIMQTTKRSIFYILENCELRMMLHARDASSRRRNAERIRNDNAFSVGQDRDPWSVGTIRSVRKKMDRRFTIRGSGSEISRKTIRSIKLKNGWRSCLTLNAFCASLNFFGFFFPLSYIKSQFYCQNLHFYCDDFLIDYFAFCLPIISRVRNTGDPWTCIIWNDCLHAIISRGCWTLSNETQLMSLSAGKHLVYLL